MMRLIKKLLLVLWILAGVSVFKIYASGHLLPHDKTKNCLWQVRSQSNTVYLLGSVHMLKEESYPLNPAIESAFEASDIVMFEVHLDSAESQSSQRLILARAMGKSGQSLEERLQPETYALASQKAAALNLSIEQFSPFKPWFLTLTLMATKMHALGFDPAYGIDRYFFNKAKADGKVIRGLETITFQIGLFDKLSQQLSDDLVLQTLEELDLIEGELETVIAAWETGDVDALSETLLKSFKEYPELYQAFIADRNLNWLEAIEIQLQGKKPALIVVGAGHLLGTDGLASLLQLKGYDVKQF